MKKIKIVIMLKMIKMTTNIDEINMMNKIKFFLLLYLLLSKINILNNSFDYY